MSAGERFLLWVGAVGTFATGAAYGWMKYLLRSDDPYAVVHHPLQPAMLKMHILFAPVLVFALGLVFTQHVWKQWRSGRPAGRRSGIATLLTAVPMIASGYLIQTVTGDRALAILIVVHLATGAAYFAMFASHRFLMGVRDRIRQRQAGERRDRLESGRDEEVA